MSKKRTTPKGYLVKRTTNGRVRFSLHNGLQYSLVDCLSNAANQAPPDVLNFAALDQAQGRAFAQEALARFNLAFYPQADEKRFVLRESEALVLLRLLWSDPGLVHRQYLQQLFGDLHQLLA